MALRTTGEHSGGRLWAVLTLVTVIGAALIPLIHEPRYYFFGDTQIGAFGQWYHLGTELRSGHSPLLDPQECTAAKHARQSALQAAVADHLETQPRRSRSREQPGGGSP